MERPSPLKVGIIFLLFWADPVHGWYEHHYLTPLMWDTEDPRLVQILNTRVMPLCAEASAKIYATLASELQLNPDAQVGSYALVPCEVRATDNGETSIGEIVAGLAIDDPDAKIDQDLPAAYDLADERKLMGGRVGVLGQGFRHMFFGGWKWSSPLSTFQIPARPLGQAPTRIHLMAQRAKRMIQEGNLEWGVRLIVWAMHYAQDLAQPFHAAQFPSLRMLAWYELTVWPFTHIFERLLATSALTTRNFHWAYEGYVRHQFKYPALLPYERCLTHPEEKHNLALDPESESEITDNTTHENGNGAAGRRLIEPRDLGAKIATASIQLSSPLGTALHHFFGDQLNRQGLDMAQDPNHLDYRDYATRPELREARTQIHDLTCQAMANASLASRQLLLWAFEP